MNLRPPSITTLTEHHLRTRSQSPDLDMLDTEVEPHEVLNGFRIDARTPWADSLVSLKLFGIKDIPTALPPEWTAWISGNGSGPAVPCAAGRFPQRVRDLATLLAGDWTALLPHSPRTEVEGLFGLRSWIERNQKSESAANRILANGIAVQLGAKFAESVEPDSAATANERAAALWDSGQCEDALSDWTAQNPHPIVEFNQGMALLFLGRPSAAIGHLRAAAAALPDTSGWPHLARLYLALAEAKML